MGWGGCLGPSLLATRRKPAAGASLDLSREARLRRGREVEVGGGRRELSKDLLRAPGSSHT